MTNKTNNKAVTKTFLIHSTMYVRSEYKIYFNKNNHTVVWSTSPMYFLNMCNQTLNSACSTSTLSKSAVSAFHACTLLYFTLEDSWRHDQCSSMTKGSFYHIKQINLHTTFYHSSGLTRNLMFNGSIYYVLYLQILCFYLGRQN